MSNSLGVCSWSLRASSPGQLVERVHATGLDAIQLDLGPLQTGAWSTGDTLARLGLGRIRILSGMIGTYGEDYTTLDSIRRTGGVRSDEHWPANLEAAKLEADIASELQLDLVTFHAGFLPESSGDPERTKLIDRLRVIADLFAAKGITVAFETGQETATTMLGVLDELERPDVGVNFDPANILLYGMGDPIEALTRLAARIRQVHIKDAIPAMKAGTWGTEVPVGEGRVDWKRFFDIVREKELSVDLLIEREAGDDRIDDITTARALVQGFLVGQP